MVAGRVLPTFTPEEIELHNSTKSCSVTVGLRVYDLTPFLDGHPGGRELILEYAGQDVKKILRNPISHEHSATAYEVLKENLVGFLAPGSNGPSVNGAQPAYGSTEMRLVEDRSIETASENTHTHEFLDLNKPLFAQLWYSGFSKEFYLEQIHHPRHYKVGESAPIFGNFLEPLTKTAWYVVPIIWLPPVVYGTYLGFAGMGSASPALSYWIFGFFLWSFIEYAIHRFLFHIDWYDPQSSLALDSILS